MTIWKGVWMGRWVGDGWVYNRWGMGEWIWMSKWIDEWIDVLIIMIY